MKIKFSTGQFIEALQEYAQVCNKDMAEELNKTAKSIAYKAMGLTPKMDTDKKYVSMEYKPQLKNRTTKSGKLVRRKGATVGGATYESRLYFAIGANAHKKGEGAYNAALKKWRKARGGKGYTGASWGPAIQDLGGSPTANARKFLRHAGSKEGGAKKAREHLHRVIITNTAGGSEKVGYEAMVRAKDIVFQDRIPHMRESIAKRAKAASGRKNNG